MIYLDNASTTCISKSVENAMIPYLKEIYGNPGSQHKLGRVAKKALEDSRKQVALLFDNKPEHIIFTSSGSEANTLAIIGISNYLKSMNRTHIITTKIEHPSVYNSIKELQKSGFAVEYLSAPNGIVSIDELVSKIRNDTGLVSIMYVNNELGSLNDVHALSTLLFNKGIIFHTDCVQAAGTYPLNNINADMVTISGHKIHAPKGVGALYIKNPKLIKNIIYGGEQEYGIRPGTENVPAIVGFGTAASDVYDDIKNGKRTASVIMGVFYDRLFNYHSEEVKQWGIKLNGQPHKDGKILNICVKDTDAMSMLLLLEEKGLLASAGAACSSNTVTPSRVLTSIGLDEEDARASIRLSFSKYNTVREALMAADTIIDCAKIIKEI